MAPWLFATVFAYMALDSLAVGNLSVFQPVGALLFLGFVTFGFLMGIPFWIRDRRRENVKRSVPDEFSGVK